MIPIELWSIYYPIPTLHVTWILFLWEKSFILLFRIPHFCARDLWTELHLFTLSIPKVVRDQVWYERPTFYNSNFFKPNVSASPFREAQLKRFQTSQRWHPALTPATLRRAQESRCSWRLFRIRDLTPSDAWDLVPTKASAKYTEEDLRTMTKFCMDSFLQLQAGRPKPAGHQEVWGLFRYRRRPLFLM